MERRILQLQTNPPTAPLAGNFLLVPVDQTNSVSCLSAEAPCGLRDVCCKGCGVP